MSGYKGSNTTVPAGGGTGTMAIGGTLGKGSPLAATTGTSEQILATVSIPANTMNVDGMTILVWMFWHTANNTNSKVIKVRLGGIAGAIAFDSGTSLSVAGSANQDITGYGPLEIHRTSATTAATGWQCHTTPDKSNTLGSINAVWFDRSLAVTWANALDLVITAATAAAAGDLTLDSYCVILCS